MNDQTNTADRPAKKAYHHGDLRAALIEAARDELHICGIEGFSLRKVAARAGVSHAAPAHHFKDASGLLTALATEGFKRFLSAMKRREAACSEDPHAQVLGAGLGYLDFALAERALFRLIHASDRPDFSDPDLSVASRAAFEHLLDLVGTAMKAGGGTPTPDEIYVSAAAVWSMAHGLADLRVSGRLETLGAMSEPEQTAALRSILGRAMGGQ